jgi:hypothetical protein
MDLASEIHLLFFSGTTTNHLPTKLVEEVMN